MGWKQTILMTVLSIALGVMAILTLDLGEVSRDTGQSGPLLDQATFPMSKFSSIELTRGDERWLFAREGEEWWQLEPFRAPIEGRNLMAVAERAVDLQIVDRFTPDDELSLESLKLDSPEATMTFTWAGAVVDSTRRRGVAGRGYLQLDDDPTVLVINQSSSQSSIPIRPPGQPSLSGIDIEGRLIRRVVGDQELVLQRSGRTWRFESPMKTRTDEEAMGTYVVELARANAMGVMLDQPDSLSAFGLDEPLALIEVVEKDGTARKLMIGDRVGGRTQDRYAMIEGIPSIIRLEAKVLAAILEDPIRLVDPRATGVSSPSVKSIIIRSPGQEIELERDLDRWLARSHDDAEVPADRVESLIELLTDIPGAELAIMESYPRELEAGTITLLGYDQRPLDTVRVLRETPADGSRWGLENGDGVIRIHPTLLTVPLVDRDWDCGDPRPDPSTVDSSEDRRSCPRASIFGNTDREGHLLVDPAQVGITLRIIHPSGSREDSPRRRSGSHQAAHQSGAGFHKHGRDPVIDMEIPKEGWQIETAVD